MRNGALMAGRGDLRQDVDAGVRTSMQIGVLIQYAGEASQSSLDEAEPFRGVVSEGDGAGHATRQPSPMSYGLRASILSMSAWCRSSATT